VKVNVPGWQRVATAPALPAPAMRLALDDAMADRDSALTATVYLGAAAPLRT
jgi:hypothetical protein